MRDIGVLLTGLLLAGSCLAERVQVPLSLDAGFIESALRERVFDHDRLRINDDGSGCQYLELRRPRVEVANGRVLLSAAADVRAGRAVGDRCLLVLNWQGDLELVERPEVAAGGDAIVLRTESWRALRADGTTAALSTAVGRWLEQFLPAGFQRLRMDFARPLGELRAFLTSVSAPTPAPGAGIHPDSLAIDTTAVRGNRVTVTLGVDAGAPAGTPPAVESPLSDAELTRLRQQLDAVDAFFTYTIKSMSPGTQRDAALLDVLVALRRELVQVLTEPSGRGPEPVRALFVHAWRGLAPVLRSAAEQQPDVAGSLRYLTFIGAGDALRALDDLGPTAGVEISVDGLRRLARMLMPDDTGDPLSHGDEVDAELRRVLGFGPPLPPPQATAGMREGPAGLWERPRDLWERPPDLWERLRICGSDLPVAKDRKKSRPGGRSHGSKAAWTSGCAG